MKNVILIGMPGSGKSTLGILLAKQLHYGYIDSDSIIVALAGMRLPQMIREMGNEGFLAFEAKVNASLEVEGCVIATGGSAIYRGDAIEKMKENGVAVYLQISCQEMIRRLGDPAKRGVVLQEGFSLEDLYRERAPLYQQHADLVLPLDGEESVEESAKRLAELLQGVLEEEKTPTEV
ncbi:MAG: shikimate kinase [Clostridia bacterium]|nr:shikimate kinase [Clostridia bacterium]